MQWYYGYCLIIKIIILHYDYALWYFLDAIKTNLYNNKMIALLTFNGNAFHF